VGGPQRGLQKRKSRSFDDEAIAWTYDEESPSSGTTAIYHSPPAICWRFVAFRRHCFVAARLLSGRVSRIELPSGHTGNNFAFAVLQLPEGPVAVLLNAHFPPNAAEPQPQRARRSFVLVVSTPRVSKASCQISPQPCGDRGIIAAPWTPASLSLLPAKMGATER
jgi:hypothetical protein